MGLGRHENDFNLRDFVRTLERGGKRGRGGHVVEMPFETETAQGHTGSFDYNKSLRYARNLLLRSG